MNKMKSSAIVLLFFLSISCFGFGSLQKDTLYDRYKNNIVRITENHDKFMYSYIDKTIPDEYFNSITEKSVIDLGNGLFILTENIKMKGYANTKKTICYNVYHNNINNFSEIRLLEIIQISDYLIDYVENGFVISTAISKKIRDEFGHPKSIEQKVKIVFEFDLSKKMKNYKIVSLEKSVLENEFLFSYNDDGNLESIFSVHYWGNVLCKSIYYDGNLRILERPFFDDLQITNLDEIVVMENNAIKYHSKRFYYDFVFSHLPVVTEDFLTNDKYYRSYLTLFDAKGEIIKQTIFVEANNEEYNIEYIQFDETGNWTEMKVGRDNYKREIVYK